jgi:TPR repeat protein
MGIRRSRACTVAAALLLALLPMASGALAAEAHSYTAENIEKTFSRLGWICMVHPLCPATEEVRNVIKRAIANDRSAEYLLGLTLMTGDGLPSDRDAGLDWILRAAELGDPGAARDIRRPVAQRRIDQGG